MSRRLLFEEPRILLPQPPDDPIDPQAFMILPVSALPGHTPEHRSFEQWIYEQAFARARAATRPSILERDLLGYWN